MDSPFTSLFNVNHIPTDEEIAQAQSLVQNYEILVDELNKEIEPIKAKLSVLLEQRKTFTDLITKHRDLISVVRRLPSDVLSTIFLSCLPESSRVGYVLGPHHPAVVLSHVCQRWRHIALETPSLWSTILIVLPTYNGVPEVTNGTEQMSEDGEVYLQRWLSRARLIHDLAQIWLSRSKSCSIMLKFYASDVLNTTNQIERTPPAILSALRDLVDLACGVCERWRELEFRGTVSDCDKSPLTRLLLVPEEKLPLLERVLLTLSVPRIGDVAQAAPSPNVLVPSRIGLLNAERLRELDLQPPSDARIVEWNQNWSLLVDLRLLGLALIDIEGEAFLALLRQCPNLVTAEFDLPVRDSNGTEFQNNNTPSDNPVVCANLQVLKFRRSLPPAMVPLSLSLPSLRSLTVGYTEYTVSAYLHAGGRFMPWIIRFGETLHSLQLSSFLPNPLDLHRCFSELLPNLTDLKISGIPDFLSPVTEIFFTILTKYVASSPGAGDTLDSTLGAQDEKHTFRRGLPKLERISCDAGGNALWAERQVIRFIASRRPIGDRALEGCCPIQQVRVEFPYARTIDPLSALKESGVDVEGLDVKFSYPGIPKGYKLVPA